VTGAAACVRQRSSSASGGVLACASPAAMALQAPPKWLGNVLPPPERGVGGERVVPFEAVQAAVAMADAALKAKTRAAQRSALAAASLGFQKGVAASHAAVTQQVCDARAARRRAGVRVQQQRAWAHARASVRSRGACSTAGARATRAVTPCACALPGCAAARRAPPPAQRSAPPRAAPRSRN
jgi:hypothetical protein